MSKLCCNLFTMTQEHCLWILGSERWYHRRILASCSAATCAWVSRSTDNICGESSLCERRFNNSSRMSLCSNLSLFVVTLCSTLIVATLIYSLLADMIFLKFQQHSFYELIINKARGKSGPVMPILVNTSFFPLFFLLSCDCFLYFIKHSYLQK